MCNNATGIEKIYIKESLKLAVSSKVKLRNDKNCLKLDLKQVQLEIKDWLERNTGKQAEETLIEEGRKQYGVQIRGWKQGQKE